MHASEAGIINVTLWTTYVSSLSRYGLSVAIMTKRAGTLQCNVVMIGELVAPVVHVGHAGLKSYFFDMLSVLLPSLLRSIVHNVHAAKRRAWASGWRR